MNVENDTLALIRTSFTGQDEIIERAFCGDRSFRALCEDYRECVTALDRWKRRTTAEAPLRRQEYADLLVKLDREIQAWLDEMESGEAIQDG